MPSTTRCRNPHCSAPPALSRMLFRTALTSLSSSIVAVSAVIVSSCSSNNGCSGTGSTCEPMVLCSTVSTTVVSSRCSTFVPLSHEKWLRSSAGRLLCCSDRHCSSSNSNSGTAIAVTSIQLSKLQLSSTKTEFQCDALCKDEQQASNLATTPLNAHRTYAHIQTLSASCRSKVQPKRGVLLNRNVPAHVLQSPPAQRVHAHTNKRICN
eukprot:16762-Heterococcus_DN1.PRE.1